MEKVSLKILILAAAAISPQIITPPAEAFKAKHVDELSVQKRDTITKSDVRCVYTLERK